MTIPTFDELEMLINLYKMPVPHCKGCGGPVEFIEHQIEETVTPEDPIEEGMRTKDDPPLLPEKVIVILKSALCENRCGWEPARSEPCCEAHDSSRKLDALPKL